jgi:DNA-binding HxlR family transcriptional regulator
MKSPVKTAVASVRVVPEDGGRKDGARGQHDALPAGERGESTAVAAPATAPATATASALDRLIHERLRLGIVSALAVNETLSFSELKQLLDTTDGNLSVHARKLEEAHYVVCTKTFERRVPHTQYALTPLGRRALARYLDHMEALIRATRER